FTPLFYLVWSDDLLSQKEFLTLQKFIVSQNWLSTEEQEYLLSKIASSLPPSTAVLSSWKSEIESLTQKNPSIRSLFDVSLLLSANDTNIKDLKINFLKLENDLGISGEAAMVDFKTSTKTFTSNYQTNNRLKIEKITQILDGEQATIIKKVKAIISRPEFAYETSTDIAVYREKVYEWCKILAEENLGNIGYPTQHGGGGAIQDYFAVMETLSYHDLSLVIKFGVQFGLWGMSVKSLGTEKHYSKYL
ncbi:MAG: acyl-CoA dehydrogenase family protein, partial [Flavobacterium sp.]